VNGEVTNITVADNWMQCPRCGTLNKQALPDGEYNIRGGQWQLIRRIAKDILSEQATSAEILRLAELLKEAKASSKSDEHIADTIESRTCFKGLADTVRNLNHNHPPGWGAYIIALILSIIGIIYPLMFSEAQAPPPSIIQHLSPQQVDQLAQQVANDLERQWQNNHRNRPARPLGPNQSCSCGSGLKYKKCCGDPRKRN
jgi:SEC-C motif